jgi:hypothetical protein
MTTDQPIGNIFKFGLHATGFYNLALSYSVATNITTAVLIAEMASNLFKELISRLKSSPNPTLNPLTFACNVSEVTIEVAIDKLAIVTRSLNFLEETTSSHPHADRPQGDPLKLDFKWSTRLLTSISTMLGITRMRLQSLISVLEAIKKQNGGLRPEPLRLLKKSPVDCFHCLEEQIRNLSDLSAHLLVQTEYEQKRTETQLAVVGSPSNAKIPFVSCVY